VAVINKRQLRKNKTIETAEVTEQKFLAKAEDYQSDTSLDLSILSIEELAIQYIEIDRQSHLLKGKILLEARARFQSDKEFGQWISTHSLCVGSQQSRNRLMHLASFFDDNRDMTGITITSAYEISSPANRDKAMDVYKKVYGKNVSVKQVKALFLDKKIKTETASFKKPSKKYIDSVEQAAVDLVDNKMSGETDEFILDVLQKAIKYLNQKSSSKSGK